MSEFIELHGGIVTKSTTVSARGAFVDPTHIGQHRFFVSYVEPEGDWFLWDGESYDEAIVIAEKARSDFGITEPVRDIVVIGGGQ